VKLTSGVGRAIGAKSPTVGDDCPARDDQHAAAHRKIDASVRKKPCVAAFCACCQPRRRTTAPGSVLKRTLFPGSTTRFLLFTLNRLAASNALAALRLRNILPGVLQATLTSDRSLISNLKSGGPHTLRRCQPHRSGSRHQNACAVAPYSGYRQHRRRNLARPGGEVLQGRDHRRQRFNCCVRWQKGRMSPLGQTRK
jgi:hypothetical protein